MLKGLWDRCSELQALNFQCMSFMFPCLGFRSILDRRRFPTSLVQFQLLWVSLVCKTKASFDHGFWWFPAEILIVAMPKESIPADHWVVLAIIWPNVSISECWLPPNSPGSQWQVEEELKSQKIDDEERRRLEKALWKFMASLELLRSMGIWQSERQPISCWIGWWHLNTVCLSVLYAVLWCITMYYVYVCVYIYTHTYGNVMSLQNWFGVSQKSWLSASLTVSNPRYSTRSWCPSPVWIRLRMMRSNCRKWVVRGVAKMLQKVGEETMTSQHHSDKSG